MARDIIKWKFSDNVWTYRGSYVRSGWISVNINEDGTVGSFNVWKSDRDGCYQLGISRELNGAKKMLEDVVASENYIPDDGHFRI